MGINVGDKYIIEIGAVAELPDGKKKYFIKPFESLVFDRKGLEQLKKFDNAADALYQAGFKEGYKKAQSRPDLRQLKDDSYSKGYEDGAKNQDEVQYQKGYNKGLEDGRAEATYNTDLIDELKQVEYIRGLEDAWKLARKIEMLTCGEVRDIFGEKALTQFGDEEPSVFAIINQFSYQESESMIKAYEEKKKAEEESIKVGDEVITSNGYIAIITFICDEYMTAIFHDGSSGEFINETLKKTGRHFGEVEQLLDKLREYSSEAIF